MEVIGNTKYKQPDSKIHLASQILICIFKMITFLKKLTKNESGFFCNNDINRGQSYERNLVLKETELVLSSFFGALVNFIENTLLLWPEWG